MRLIDADGLLDECKFYHLPNGDLAVPIIDVQHAPTVEAISRTQAIEAFETAAKGGASIEDIKLILAEMPSAQPDLGKYEYHYDHTDCIWYRPEARNRCPVTCAQYRDGWNDAMNYIFRDGKGYRPYRREEQYEE